MSTHLETLRLMRAMAVGDHAAALDHAIAVLDGCEALNHAHWHGTRMAAPMMDGSCHQGRAGTPSQVVRAANVAGLIVAMAGACR